jgi:TPR repeat protein
MDRYIKQILKGLIPVLLMVSNSVAASSAELNNAIQIYYAGLPRQAINLIKPLALSGDVDAQYLLGNILYSLSTTSQQDESEDPLEWYKMAAVQHSPGANYALGVIYHNRWGKSKRKADSAIAIFYYERAVKLGIDEAQAHLSSLKLKSATASETKPVSKSGSTAGQAKQTTQMPVANGARESGAASLAAVTKPVPTEASNQETGMVSLANTASQLPPGDSGQASITVDLAEIASQCQNYTQVGFNYYAESIKGALLTGNALIEAIEPNPSKADTRLLKLSHQKFDIEILLSLQDVPKNIAAGLKPGRDFGVTGIVGLSQKQGASCDLMLTYQSSK